MTGQFVKEKIEQSGVSLAELARRLHTSPQNLVHRLSVKDIKVSVLLEIASAIGKELAYFVEGYNPAKAGKSETVESSQEPDTVVQLLAAKDELIAAQRLTIQMYEEMLRIGKP